MSRDTVLAPGQMLLVNQTRRANCDWEIDADAVQAEIDRLGLRHPVRVGRYVARKKCGDHSFGFWRTPNAGLVLNHDRTGVRGHDIRVNTLVGLTTASRTLYHELEHARQEEEFLARNDDFDKHYKINPDYYESLANAAEIGHDLRGSMTRKVER